MHLKKHLHRIISGFKRGFSLDRSIKSIPKNRIQSEPQFDREGSPEPSASENAATGDQTLCRVRIHSHLNAKEVAANSEDITKKFNTPHPQGHRTEGWIFKVVNGLDTGRQYIATTPVVKVGRKSDNHIYLKDPKVSRYHAVIKFNGDKLYIRDLGSTNGTRVNERNVFGERELFPGELIRVGDTVIQLERVSFHTSEAL